MRKLCIINQKGGVAKTTTAVNVAAGLARKNRNVLLVDLDPQGSVAHSLTTSKEKSVYEFLTGECSHVDCITPLGKNLDLIHSNDSLTKIDVFIARNNNTTSLVKDKFGDVAGYDYIIFDCAPSLGLLNQNVMVFADDAIIPVATNHLSYVGLQQMVSAIGEINEHFGSSLEIKHIVPTMHDIRNRSNKKVLTELKAEFADIVTTPIRINAKLAEAPSKGRSIFGYDPKSRGAEDYGKLVETILLSESSAPEAVPIQEQAPISQRVQQMMKDVVIED